MFHVDPDVAVLHEDKMTDILDATKDEMEQDAPLMFRELLTKLRLKLLHSIKDDDILLRGIQHILS